MKVIVTSPDIDRSQITAWCRQLYENTIMIDGAIKGQVVDITQFQIERVKKNKCRVAVLVDLLAPMKPQVVNAKPPNGVENG